MSKTEGPKTEEAKNLGQVRMMVCTCGHPKDAHNGEIGVCWLDDEDDARFICECDEYTYSGRSLVPTAFCECGHAAESHERAGACWNRESDRESDGTGTCGCKQYMRDSQKSETLPDECPSCGHGLIMHGYQTGKCYSVDCGCGA